MLANAEHAATRQTAARLNHDCFCRTVDAGALTAALDEAAGEAGFADRLARERPNLFAGSAVFLPGADLEAMQATVAAIEALAALPAYRLAVAQWMPPIAAQDFGPRGAFMGYDFHLGASGPKLIEVNTNAGGAFLAAAQAQAMTACCAGLGRGPGAAGYAAFVESVRRMFEAEWRAQRGAAPLRRIAIVDDAPDSQFLNPEFQLARRALAECGYATTIADASALSFDGGQLRAEGQPIDLVYNRLVDFALAEPRHDALRAAYAAGAVVVTPGPRNHALFADKRNLTLLSDTEALRRWGLAEAHRAILARVPPAVPVTAGNAETLWRERKRYFFKPAAGHGSKSVYRGDKLTRATWERIAGAGGIAQELAPPSERRIRIGEETLRRKLDVRLYVYDGAPLLAAARLYDGQTTNFRTPGGGFAPVFFLGAGRDAALACPTP